MLRQELPYLRPKCLRMLEATTTLLQAGAEAGLTLYQLANVMTRGTLPGGDEAPSTLENLVAIATDNAAKAAGSSPRHAAPRRAAPPHRRGPRRGHVARFVMNDRGTA